MSDLLPFVDLATGAEPRYCVIWLHGLGADGHDFEPIVPELHLAPEPAIRFIFPHAPLRPVTVNGGMVMRAWYDFRTLNFDEGENTDDIETSVAQVTALVAAMADAGFPPERIVLAGFSQGGVIALHTALRYTQRLGGVIALSTYLPRGDDLQARLSPANRGLSVFSGHGTHDPMIPFAGALHARDWLKSRGYDLETHDYAMPHAVSPKELEDIARWLTARVQED